MIFDARMTLGNPNDAGNWTGESALPENCPWSLEELRRGFSPLDLKVGMEAAVGIEPAYTALQAAA